MLLLQQLEKKTLWIYKFTKKTLIFIGTRVLGEQLGLNKLNSPGEKLSRVTWRL